MANIAGAKFGTLCDHQVRRFVILHFDEIIGFYIDLPADVDVAAPTLTLYVNNEVFVSAEGVVFPENTKRVVFGDLGGGFGFAGYGSGGYGQGGFNSAISIADLGGFPVDDVELSFRTTPDFCPKCIHRADDGSVVVPSTGQIIGYGSGGYGQGPYGGE